MSVSRTPNSGRSSHRSKKKTPIIDKITEDTFSENLLLGLVPLLKACPFVSHIQVASLPPATVDQVAHWECSNCTRLPLDLRNFYLSSNGFCFSYRFQYDREDVEEPSHVIGGITINPLSQLEGVAASETWYMAERGTKVMVPQTRVFLLSQLENSSVVVASFSSNAPPTLWLYYKMKNFFFLCEDLRTYLRMGLAHLGVPGWQLAVLHATLPEWSSELFRIAAPGVLHKPPITDQSVVNIVDARIFGGGPEEKGETGGPKKSARKK